MNFSKRTLDCLSDVLLIEPRRFVDSRGHFFEAWSQSAFAALGLELDFVQDNVSLSTFSGTLRGLHFQTPPHEQAKLVTVVRGAVYDVVVDVRPNSPTRGQWAGVSLTADKGEMLFVPRGFAHGFVTLVDETVVSYKVDAPYAVDCEAGIRWNDPTLNISWPIKTNVTLSDKDACLPLYDEPLNARSAHRAMG